MSMWRVEVRPGHAALGCANVQHQRRRKIETVKRLTMRPQGSHSPVRPDERLPYWVDRWSWTSELTGTPSLWS